MIYNKIIIAFNDINSERYFCESLNKYMRCNDRDNY